MEGLCTALDRLLARPRPPTAFLVCRPGFALAAVGHLIRRGLRFPETAAFIARDHDWFFDYTVPSIAHYKVNPVLHARKLTRVAMDLALGGNPRPTEHLITPKFVPGRTLVS